MAKMNIVAGSMLKLSVVIKDWTPEVAQGDFAFLHWGILCSGAAPPNPHFVGGSLAIGQFWDKCTEPGLFQNITVKVPIANRGPAWVWMHFGKFNPGRDPNSFVPPGAVVQEANLIWGTDV